MISERDLYVMCENHLAARETITAHLHEHIKTILDGLMDSGKSLRWIAKEIDISVSYLSRMHRGLEKPTIDIFMSLSDLRLSLLSEAP